MEHYYSEEQKSPLKIKKIRQAIKNIDFEFFTAPGVFSKEHVDRGTMVLAESMVLNKGDKILDIGCGIGILGIVAAKAFDAKAVMSDINKRAVFLAKKNAELNKVNAEIHQGSLYEKISDNDFDRIFSNPPQTAGKKICFDLIEKSKGRLKKGGTLQIVARHNKGGKALSKKMGEVFGNSKIIARKSGYSVYLSSNG